MISKRNLLILQYCKDLTTSPLCLQGNFECPVHDGRGDENRSGVGHRGTKKE